MLRRKWKLAKGSLLLACALSAEVISGNSVLAKQTDDISLQYVKTVIARAYINIDAKGNIDCIGRMEAEKACKKVAMNVHLQKFSSGNSSWKNVKSWSVTQNSSRASLSQTYHVTARGKYRVKVSGTMYTSSGSESVTAVSATKTY